MKTIELDDGTTVKQIVFEVRVEVVVERYDDERWVVTGVGTLEPTLNELFTKDDIQVMANGWVDDDEFEE